MKIIKKNLKLKIFNIKTIVNIYYIKIIVNIINLNKLFKQNFRSLKC